MLGFFSIPTFVFLALACGRQVCNAFLKENLVLIGLKNPHSTKGGIANSTNQCQTLHF